MQNLVAEHHIAPIDKNVSTQQKAKATLPSNVVPHFAPFLRPNAPSSLEPPGNRGSAPTRALASFSNLEADTCASNDSMRLVPGGSRGQPGGTVETALVPQFHSGPLPPLQILRGVYAPHDHNAFFINLRLQMPPPVVVLSQ